MEIKILTTPYLVTPNKDVRVSINYSSGGKRKAGIKSSEKFYCARANYKDKEISLFKVF